MAMLSSYTLLSRAPAPAPVLAKSSPAGAVQLRLRSRQPPAAAASVAALRCNESRSRAALFACHAANNDKNTSDVVDIEHVLEEPSIWDVKITAQKDRTILKLRVGESSSTSKGKLKLTTTEDQARLVIRYIGDNSPASELNIELTIPPGCDGKKAQGWLLADGWLIITIAKPKEEEVIKDESSAVDVIKPQ